MASARYRFTDPQRQVVSYIRVSTQKQGRSGLGLEAQREAIARFCAAEHFTIATEHVEVESGKGADALEHRPKLDAATKAAKKVKASDAGACYPLANESKNGD